MTDGATAGARDSVFRPGKPTRIQNFTWDIGSAGSTTALALAVLPVLTFGSTSLSIELRGAFFKTLPLRFIIVQHVLLSLLYRMAAKVMVRMERPGYVPTGQGIWHLRLSGEPAPKPLLRIFAAVGVEYSAP